MATEMRLNKRNALCHCRSEQKFAGPSCPEMRKKTHCWDLVFPLRSAGKCDESATRHIIIIIIIKYIYIVQGLTVLQIC